MLPNNKAWICQNVFVFFYYFIYKTATTKINSSAYITLEKKNYPLLRHSSYNATKKIVAKTMSRVFPLTHIMLLLAFYSQSRFLAGIFFREKLNVSSISF